MTDFNTVQGADAFNFSAMKAEIGKDPFATPKTSYKRDERFYVLQKDKEGNGAALIRFLPDSERGMIQRMYKISTTITKNGKKRFVSEFSPSTINQPCIFQEKWQMLWNSNLKEEARQFSRGVRFVSNIKVLKDPANPENEGKIFLYEMSGSMKDKLQAAIDPSEQDRSLGAKPKELFNPLQGNSFRLVAKKGANNQINYDSSEVLNDISSIYDSVDEALTDIKENAYKLSDLLKPESFLSYEELKEKMAWVTFEDVQTQPLTAQVAEPVEIQEVRPVQTVQPVQTAQTAQPVEVAQTAQPVQTPKEEVKNDVSLDSLLSGLV